MVLIELWKDIMGMNYHCITLIYVYSSSNSLTFVSIGQFYKGGLSSVERALNLLLVRMSVFILTSWYHGLSTSAFLLYHVTPVILH
jgi:hypothetical protein